MAQARQDPALRDLHGHFDFRFVPRLGRSRRQNDRAVVRGPFFVGALENRLVATRVTDPRLQLIRVVCPLALCARGPRRASADCRFF
jgi:hypothetical protein